LTSGELLLKTIRREVDRPIPFDIEFDTSATQHYRDRFGGDPYEYFRIGYRRVYVNDLAACADTDYRKYYDALPAEAKIGVYGDAAIYAESEAVRHFYPMERFSTARQIEEYPFPDFTRERCWIGLRERVKSFHERALVVIGTQAEILFPRAWHLRGMAEFLVDLALHRHMAEALLDKILAAQVPIVKGLTEAGVDVVWLGMDVAMQNTTMISPSMWAAWMKPRMKTMVDAAKSVNPNVIFAIHCCGAVGPLLPHLADIGVTIINPVQPEAVNLTQVKKDFGNVFTFWGGVSVQRTMPFGTPEQVRAEVPECARILGKGGGYVCAPAHGLTHDVPWENVVAFVEAASALADSG